MGRKALFSLGLLTLGLAGGARAADVLYSNTTTDTLETVFYSVGPYAALGDQMHLISTGVATQASVEMFNNGTAGTFDAELALFLVGTSPASPVGTSLGTFDVTGISSAGGDVIDFNFTLGAGVAVPQDLIFTLSVSNLSPNMDLGVDMFEPPTVGSSDNSFMIAATSTLSYIQLGTASENVYFQLTGQADSSVPEPSSAALLFSGMVILVLAARLGSRAIS